MLAFLAKLFIKNYKDYANTTVREGYGVLCGIVGIVFNILLFSFKIVCGIISHSVAMAADAFNNLSDAATSIVSIVGFKMSQKPSDAEHPFGHGRLEYIAGLIISFLILSMGIELFKSSISKIFVANEAVFSLKAVAVLLGAVMVKLYMFFYNTCIAKKISSVTLEAVAKDSLSDIIGTTLVLASQVASLYTSFPLDAVAGIIVACFILYTGFSSCKDTIRPLVGTKPTAELVESIKNELKNRKYIIGMHDLVIHDYGPGRLIVHLHAEVPGDINIFTLHEIIDKAEVDISHKFNCVTVIHMDPIDQNNKELQAYKDIIKEKTQELDKTLSVHDVRMVPGENNTNLIFDLVVPYTCKLPISKISDNLKHNIEAVCPKVQCVITAERSYCD